MHIEIWSDIACPWCYLGKRRFETALADFEHRDDVTVTYRSFELDPEAPAERAGERAAYLAAKYGMKVEQARAMEDQMTMRAAADGLRYRLDIARAGNTFDAHRMLHLAAAHGVQAAAKERFMRAYFSEGQLMSDHETLVRLSTDVGIPEADARHALASGRFTAEVREDERTAQELGIRGVPFFVIDRRYGVSGAQSPEVLLSALQRAREESGEPQPR
jgi:predicted DsbA family dithiol-disulfide isomerase